MKLFGNKIIWLSVVVQYGVAGYLLYTVFLPLPDALKIAFLGLAMAIASSASADMKGVSDRKKLNEILDGIKKIDKRLESEEDIANIVKAGIAVVNYIKRKM